MSDIKVIRGDDKTFTVTITDSNGDAVDITGYTVFFTVKAEADLNDADDTDALISKTITSHTNAAGGITTITLTDSDTNQTPGNYLYDIQIKDDGGLIKTVNQTPAGFTVVADVTRRIV